MFREKHWWYVIKLTSSGREQIYQSETWGSTNDDFTGKKNRRKMGEYYHEMINFLLAQGWEPVQTDAIWGHISMMKREVGAKTPTASLDPTNLLEQLASLHKAGILTDEEYQAKKTEILNRI